MGKYFVKTNVAHIHLKSSDVSEVCSQAIYGSVVDCIEVHGEWSLISTDDGYQGWIQTRQLQHCDHLLPIHATVNSLFAHLYAFPDTSARAPLITLPFNAGITLVNPKNTQERWLEVDLIGGGSAWVQKGDLSFSLEPLILTQVLALSHRFIGLPYTWGGVSTFGFDCSGFVQMLYRQADVILPRDSYLQAESHLTFAVALTSLEAGDLLFFSPKDKRISHVGLYLGDDRMIHTKAKLSEGAPAVQIHQLSAPVWDEALVSARRIYLKNRGKKNETV